MKGFNIGMQIAAGNIVNVSAGIGLLTIEFEDKGQDFLEWDICKETGKILDCRPFQAHVWCRMYVFEPTLLKIGDRIHISRTSIDPTNLEQEFLTVNYPVVKITSK